MAGMAPQLTLLCDSWSLRSRRPPEQSIRSGAREVTTFEGSETKRQMTGHVDRASNRCVPTCR